MSELQGEVPKIFEAHLDLIQEVIRSIARRHRLRPEEAADFGSYVLLKLIDNDYRILRSFRGKSSLRTYLMTVVQRQFLDYRIEVWGKWRPSAESRRLGKWAEELDRLLFRDGHSLDAAVEILQAKGAEVSRDELLAMAQRIPVRVRPRCEGEQGLDQILVDGAVDERVVERERRLALRRVRGDLAKVFRELPPQDRLILKMRYLDGCTIREIAEALQLEARRLYRRVEGCLKRLRASLERHGVTRQDVVPLLGKPGTEIGLHGVLELAAVDPTPRSSA
jgi:RNA polymerase sigma factor (sigma-70 family)